MKLTSRLNTAGRRYYFLCYTILFLSLSFLIFSPFWWNGKSLIWKPDGLTQHFNSLVYFRNWGLTILRTLVTEHRLSVPLWDSAIGYGSDVLTTLHYYVIGDPLNLLSFLVPVRFLEGLYDFLILLRLYLAGIAFSCYCFRMKREGTAVLAGSLLYVFCGYAIVLAPMHPYFINPMIYLPLLLLGVERVFHKEKGHLLIAVTALSALSNFYFFYMLVILTILYCIIRFCTMEHHNWKQELTGCLGRTLFFSVTGTAMAAVLLLPILLQFLSDMRSNTRLGFSPLYEWSYYERLLDQFVSLTYSSSWTYLCFATPALLCVLLLFLKRKRFQGLKIGFLVLTALLLLPAAGSFLNGFSYAANRWCFGYAFLIALITVFLWPDLFTLTPKETGGLLALLFAYGILLILPQTSGSSHAYFALFLVLLTLLLLREAPHLKSLIPANAPKILQKKGPQLTLLLLLCLNLCANSLLYYRSNMDNHLARFVDAGKGFSALEQSASGMANLFLEQDGEFSRYAQDIVPVRNDTLNHKAHSIHYYWSLSNGAITQFFNELALPFEERAFKYDDLDHRAQLHALAGVRWYIQYDPNKYLPYPFRDSKPFDYLEDLYYASETESYLPFGYTCAHLLSRDAYESLPYLQRQQSLLQAVVLEDLPQGTPEPPLSFADQPIPFEISHSSDILELEGSYYALTDQAELTLTFEGLPACETYLQITGLKAQGLTEWQLQNTSPTAPFFSEEKESLTPYEKHSQKRANHLFSGNAQFPITCTSEALSTTFCYYTALTESSYDRSDFLLNMGYTEAPQHTITLRLPYRGVYTFESLTLSCLPLTTLPEELNTLRQEKLENLTYEGNHITGTITLSEEKHLCLSLPYSKGWTAQVDGTPTPLKQANTMFTALPLTPGTHTIELHYRTPGLILGLTITALALANWILYLIYERKKAPQNDAPN